MKNKNIECRPMISPVHLSKHIRDKNNVKKFKTITNVAKSYFHLPSSTNLKFNEIKYICDKLIECVS